MRVQEPNGNRRAAWAVLGAAIVVRLAAGALVPLAPDETYYWEWSRRLALGYLDHPPMIALLVRLGTAALGASPIGVRIGSIAAGALASIVIVRLAGSLGGGRAMLRAAAIIACMPLAQIGLALATPDASLLLFWSLALAALVPAIRDAGAGGPVPARVTSWALVGLAVGAALSTKYTAVLLPVAVGIALVTFPPLRRVLSTSAPYAAIVAALVVFAPNLIWNARHDWASFAYQLGHGLGTHRGSALQHEAQLVGGQLGLVSPLLLAVLAASVWRAVRLRDDPVRTTLAVIASTTWLFFAATALRSAVEPNWPAPAYLSAIVLAAVYGGARRWRRLFRAALALGAVMTILIYVHAIVPFVPTNVALDPTLAGFGWDSLAARVATARAEKRPGTTAWIAGERYQEASELAFHLPDHPVTFAIDVHGRPNQYDLWPSFPLRAHTGDRLILVLGLYTDPGDDPVIDALRPHFERIALREIVDMRRGATVRAQRRVWVLDGWRGSWPEAELAR